MKFRSQNSFLQLLALAASLFWLGTAIAGGKPIKVEGVFPNVAAPNDELTVVISGSGFNDNDIVEFFFTGEEESPENSEIGVVGSSKSNGKGTELTVKIKVKDGAKELSYDIVVRTNSRRCKGTDLFSVSQSGVGKVYPTFDVTFEGDLFGGSGTLWQSSQRQKGITYFLSAPMGGTGDTALGYFEDQFPVGSICFNAITPITSVQFWGDENGMATLKMTFMGSSQDGSMDFMYHLTLNGYFDFPGDWLPSDSTTVTMKTWKLKLEKKRENRRHQNISCVGEGDFATASIWVGRN